MKAAILRTIRFIVDSLQIDASFRYARLEMLDNFDEFSRYLDIWRSAAPTKAPIGGF